MVHQLNYGIITSGAQSSVETVPSILVQVHRGNFIGCYGHAILLWGWESFSKFIMEWLILDIFLENDLTLEQEKNHNKLNLFNFK